MQTIAQTPPAVNGHTTPVPLPQFPQLPEAPCSMTSRLLVPAISREAILVTGRGHTGPEAARNLRESCAALQEPTPPPAREERLATLLACGLTRAVSKGDTGLVERLAKATALVLSGAVEPTERVQAMAVRSARHPDTWYTVEGLSCSCPDWDKHREDEGYHCKHLLAVWMQRRLAAGHPPRHVNGYREPGDVDAE